MNKFARRAGGALALCVSAFAHAADATSADGLWSLSLTTAGHPGYSFNGTRTVNASGVAVGDVPLGTLGLLHETIVPVAINDSGWVISNVYGWWSEQAWIDKDPTYSRPALSIGGVMQGLPFEGGKGGYAAAINNQGLVLINGIGPLPGTWPYEVPSFFVGPLVRASQVEYIDINDAGQIFAYGQIADTGSTIGREGYMVITPIPEPSSLALAIAGLALMLGALNMRKVLPRRISFARTLPSHACTTPSIPLTSWAMRT